MVILILVISGAIFSLTTIPILRKIIEKFDIYDPPNTRDLHTGKIPKLMGTVFYGGIVLGSPFLLQFQSEGQMLYLITALSIIYYVGVRDDIYNMSPKSKIILQFVAICITLLSTDLLITNLHGFLGIHELPIWVAYPLSLFIGIFMINSFNLIDGIDGLAGILGGLMIACYGITFYVLDDLFLVYSIAILFGAILGYLRFNLSSKKKVFMGDTGSLIIGFFIFYFLLQLINHQNLDEAAFFANKDVTIWIGLLIFLYPILDSGSVFLSRMKEGRHPFSPDNLHIHHLLLVRFKNHLAVSMILFSFTLFSVLVNALIIYFYPLIYTIFVLSYFLFSLVIVFVLRKTIKINV